MKDRLEAATGAAVVVVMTATLLSERRAGTTINNEKRRAFSSLASLAHRDDEVGVGTFETWLALCPTGTR